MAFALIKGAVAGVATLLALRLLPERTRTLAFAGLLVLAPLIYLAFAAAGGAPSDWFLVEGIGVLIYAAFAASGLRWSPWFLAVGWFAHVLWDVGFHGGGATPWVPPDYPIACITYDFLAGGYIAMKIRAAAKARSGAICCR